MLIRSRRIGLDYDVTPQAIFWRPIRYFSTYVRQDEDGLDTFSAASFEIGNQIQFDLRTYRGHPQFTVSVYMASDFKSRSIASALRAIIKELSVPKAAVAWQRGQAFAYGQLQRPEADRLREPEARILALKIAARRQNRTATTEFIKKEIAKIYPLSAIDLQLSNSRRREQLWKQIVGNVISHRATPNGPFRRGLAVRTDDGLTVTQEGIDYLNSIGFAV